MIGRKNGDTYIIVLDYYYHYSYLCKLKRMMIDDDEDW